MSFKNSRLWKKIQPVLKALSPSVQYLYFMRFSIVFWLLVPALALVDAFTGISSITRGIFAPSTFGQFFGAAFFTVCIGMVALLTARLVCLNGQDRFTTPPPRWLEKTLGTESDAWAGPVLLFFQLPGVIVLFRLHRNAFIESAYPHTYGYLRSFAGTLAGVVAAFIFWWIIDGFYYWTYSYDNSKLPARTLLFPRWWLGLPKWDQATSKATSLEMDPFNLEDKLPLIPGIFSFIGHLGPGYGDEKGRIWPGHRLAILAFIGYLAVYAFLFPLTAPSPQHYGYYVAFFAAALLFVCLALALYQSDSSSHRPKLRMLVILVLLLAVFAIVPTIIFPPFSFQGFPVLGSVLVLVTMLAFIFSSLAFWADRHRIPVFTTFILYILLIHLSPWGGDHYFRVRPRDASYSQPLKPDEIFAHRSCTPVKFDAPCPIIVVVATGGGIHAASWTATVLTELEKAMQADKTLSGQKFTFHDHLLFASTVSGGSDGLVPFLREYYAKEPFYSTEEQLHPQTTEKEGALLPVWAGRIRRAANCSSLEAVGWGLEYSDFLHIVLPLPASLNWDRSVALENAFARNVVSEKCNPTYGDEARNPDTAPPSLDTLTLARMAKDLQPNLDSTLKHLPAFTLNTTAAETGGRFLLSNYVNEKEALAGVVPAESFLDAYGKVGDNGEAEDIQLITAARLSATFPYVSSAARIQDTHGLHRDKFGADHFVDGGYFDNDGTSSAIEFLAEALRVRDPGYRDPDGRVPVLFIEIRDGADLYTDRSDESYKHQNASHFKHKDKNADEDHQDDADNLTGGVIEWNLGSQLSAPLGAFWEAGHVSVTRRNRRELELLMTQLHNKASFTHIVFDYRDPPSTQGGDTDKNVHQAAQPLSWHLTPSQMDNISKSITKLNPCIVRATDWARNPTPDATASYSPNADSPKVVCNYKVDIREAAPQSSPATGN
jgi:hypothetical protein